MDKEERGEQSSAGVHCTACGIEIECADQSVKMDKEVFCLWCWSNDCCRVSREAAEKGKAP